MCRNDGRTSFLDVEFHIVFLSPVNLGPDSFVEEHESSLEDGIGSSDFGSNANVLGDENGHRQSVANGKETPDEGLDQRTTGGVLTSLSSSTGLVHETFSDEHCERLAEEIASNNRKCCGIGSGESKRCDKCHGTGNDTPHECLDSRSKSGFGEYSALWGLCQFAAIQIFLLLRLQHGKTRLQFAQLRHGLGSLFVQLGLLLFQSLDEFIAGSRVSPSCCTGLQKVRMAKGHSDGRSWRREKRRRREGRHQGRDRQDCEDEGRNTRHCLVLCFVGVSNNNRMMILSKIDGCLDCVYVNFRRKTF